MQFYLTAFCFGLGTQIMLIPPKIFITANFIGVFLRARLRVPSRILRIKQAEKSYNKMRKSIFAKFLLEG